MKDYTVEIWKQDARTKKGKRMIGKYSETGTKEEIHELAKDMYRGEKVEIKIFETYIVRKNLMSGNEYKERYDTPCYCSPSSETYWSM
jgi:hypothetical protein